MRKKEVFSGRYNEELYTEYRHWLIYITDIYTNICGSETGNFRMLPFEGTVTDQPYMTMQIIRLVQMNYRKHLDEKMKTVKTRNRSCENPFPSLKLTSTDCCMRGIMEPVFTMQYAEYAVADFLSKNLGKTSVFVPSSAQEKGIDLLLYKTDDNGKNSVCTVQVKMSRTYCSKKKTLPGFSSHLWFNRFEVQINADWFILVGIYPKFPKITDSKISNIKWETIMLAFSNAEMKNFMSEVKQKTHPEKDDSFFGFSFNSNGEILQTRGYTINRDMSYYLIDNRLSDIKQSFI